MGINEITWRKMIGRVENRACDKEVRLNKGNGGRNEIDKEQILRQGKTLDAGIMEVNNNKKITIILNQIKLPKSH